MIFIALLLAAIAASPLPVPLSKEHMDDIGCVAVIAIAAADQARSAGEAATDPRLSAEGRKWAGIVGARASSQSGQPPELVGFAMKQAALNERKAMAAQPGQTLDRSARFDECAARMRADLVADSADAPLPPPPRKKP
jgi:hypothetical protein